MTQKFISPRFDFTVSRFDADFSDVRIHTDVRRFNERPASMNGTTRPSLFAASQRPFRSKTMASPS
jgi:hypothetical protein